VPQWLDCSSVIHHPVPSSRLVCRSLLASVFEPV
jgi:hypothetical protein